MPGGCYGHVGDDLALMMLDCWIFVPIFGRPPELTEEILMSCARRDRRAGPSVALVPPLFVRGARCAL
jgi:hypothetical protein